MTTALESKFRSLSSLLDEYNAKVAAIDENISALKAAEQQAAADFTVAGKYVSSLVTTNYISNSEVHRNLKVATWRAVWDRLGMDRLATAKDRDLFEQTIAQAPEPNAETVRSTFGPYLQDPLTHILRGLAEVFVGLDDAYKSHSKVGVGVKGLPKRIIMRLNKYYDERKFFDVLDALATYQQRPLFTRDEWFEMWKELDQTSNCYLKSRGIRVRVFKNGNAHIFFDPETLLDINMALAKFYGDVLPDVEPEDEDRKPRASTEVSKDLAYYPTPDSVVTALLRHVYLEKGSKVLEPSCGDGQILDGLRRLEPGAAVLGIEVDHNRAAQALAKGHNVLVANFLERHSDATYDAVVMNPPFYGKHYQKHVNHALTFVKDRGTLVSVLPATAKYDHGYVESLESQGYSARWYDLPVGSFAESGTRVPTGILLVYK